MSKQDFNNIPDIINELNALNNLTVRIGVINGNDFIEMIAVVNEYGTTIRPKNAKWLCIPSPLAKGRKPSEIPGLFRPKGKFILAVANGGSLDVYFYLKDKVIIPERSYLRTTFDQNEDKYVNYLQKGAYEIVSGEVSAKELLNGLGKIVKKDIRRAISLKSDPNNAAITVANKGKDNPLIDTGKLLLSIDSEVTSVDKD